MTTEVFYGTVFNVKKPTTTTTLRREHDVCCGKDIYCTVAQNFELLTILVLAASTPSSDSAQLELLFRVLSGSRALPLVDVGGSSTTWGEAALGLCIFIFSSQPLLSERLCVDLVQRVYVCLLCVQAVGILCLPPGVDHPPASFWKEKRNPPGAP